MKKAIVPALGYAALTPLYDNVVRATTREKHFKSKLLERANLVAHETVLDVGCGTGTLLNMANERHPTTKLMGLDADPEQIAVARKKLRPEIELIEGYSTELPFENGFFDCVLSSLFFHHLDVESKRTSFNEMFRVLRPNGRCLIADWGKAENLLMRGLFYQVQILDGFQNTRDHVLGLLPGFMVEAGFLNCRELDRFATVFGTIAIYEAQKPKK